jgi:hypothetical protein
MTTVSKGTLCSQTLRWCRYDIGYIANVIRAGFSLDEGRRLRDAELDHLRLVGLLA